MFSSHQSNKVASRRLLFLLDHWFHLFLKDHSHGLIEDSLESLLCQRTAFHILAFELILDDLPCCFFHNWCIFWVFFHHGELITKIDFVADKDLRNVPDVFL